MGSGAVPKRHVPHTFFTHEARMRKRYHWLEEELSASAPGLTVSISTRDHDRHLDILITSDNTFTTASMGAPPYIHGKRREAWVWTIFAIKRHAAAALARHARRVREAGDIELRRAFKVKALAVQRSGKRARRAAFYDRVRTARVLTRLAWAGFKAQHDEMQKRVRNAVIYGTSHPEAWL